MLRPVTVGTPGILFASIAVKMEKSTTNADNSAMAHYNCKATDLPIYSPLHSLNESKRQTSHPVKDSQLHKAIEGGIGIIRKELQKGLNTFSDQLSTAESYWDTAKAHTQSTIDYLNEPHNVLPRSGAIAIGGLSGFIFAARGGFIKKVLYTSIGAGAIASLCYPRQAEQVAHETLYEARKFYTITYNFVKGVKPGDDAFIEPINKFPMSLKDIKFMLYDLYDEAMEAVFPKKD